MYDHPYTPPPTQYAPGPYIPPPTPHKAPKRRGAIVVAVVSAAAALIAGVGLGAATAGSAEPAAGKGIAVVPDACVDALDAGDDIRRYAARSSSISAHTIRLVADGMTHAVAWEWAALDRDTARIKQQTAKINRLTPRMADAVDRFTTGRDACQSAD